MPKLHYAIAYLGVFISIGIFICYINFYYKLNKTFKKLNIDESGFVFCFFFLI